MNVVIAMVQAHSSNPDAYEAPDKDFMIVALDLLSGLTEGLGHHIESLAADCNLLAFLHQSAQVCSSSNSGSGSSSSLSTFRHQSA